MEVGVVFEGFPEAELDRVEKRNIGRGAPLVGDAHPPNLEVLAERNEVQRLGSNPLVARADDRVAKPMAAAVVLEVTLGRLPAGAPVFARFVVAQVDVPPTQVKWSVVVAVSADAAETGVAIEGVAAGRIRNDPEIGLIAQIVDPGQRRIRPSYDVLASLIVEMTVAHDSPLRLPLTTDQTSRPRRPRDEALPAPTESRPRVCRMVPLMSG